MRSATKFAKLHGERALQILLTAGLLRGFWYIASYRSREGDVLLFGMTRIPLTFLALWCLFLVFWSLFLFSWWRKTRTRSRLVLYALVALEALPYLYSFNVTWPYDWESKGMPPVAGQLDYCYTGEVMVLSETRLCDHFNSERLHDVQYVRTPPPGRYRAAFVGNSHVGAIGIPNSGKASKLAENELRLQPRTSAVDILDIYFAGFTVPRALQKAEDLLRAYHVQHVLLQSVVGDFDHGDVVDATSARPEVERQSSSTQGNASPPGLSAKLSRLFDETVANARENRYVKKIMFAPGSNLLALLTWRGIDLITSLNAPSESVTNDTAAFKINAALFEGSDCLDFPAAEVHKLQVLYDKARDYYRTIKALNRSGRRITFVQIPKPQPHPRSIVRNLLACQRHVLTRAFERELKGDSLYSTVDVGEDLIPAGVLPSELAYKHDPHFNQLAQSFIARKLAQAVRAYF